MIINVAGVPEHFNFPWQVAIEEGRFTSQGIELRWTDYPGGTGAMAKDLQDGLIDIAILLTEGAVTAIEKGNPSSIIQWYVKSPLVWGIHTGVNSDVKENSSWQNKKYAISRFGSGSHLMAYVDAKNRALELDETQFVVVQNLDGALDSLNKSESDLFFWEKYTTKPFVDKGQIRRVGECPTPWPCFVVVVRKEFLNDYSEKVKTVLSVIQQTCKDVSLMPDVVERIALRYQLKPEDAAAWFSALVWQTEPEFDATPLQNVKETLKGLGLL